MSLLKVLSTRSTFSPSPSNSCQFQEVSSAYTSCFRASPRMGISVSVFCALSHYYILPARLPCIAYRTLYPSNLIKHPTIYLPFSLITSHPSLYTSSMFPSAFIEYPAADTNDSDPGITGSNSLRKLSSILMPGVDAEVKLLVDRSVSKPRDVQRRSQE